MRKKIKERLPGSDLIENPKLKSRVVDTFILAIKEGGWKISDIEKIPFTLIKRRAFIGLIEHTRLVTKIALESANVLSDFYGEKIKISRDVLIVGALLHDVGKFHEITRSKKKYIKSPEGSLLRHPFSGLGLAARNNIPANVLHIIATHSKEGDGTKRTVEGIIVHYADFMAFDVLE